jgi:hypothetical protein
VENQAVPSINDIYEAALKAFQSERTSGKVSVEKDDEDVSIEAKGWAVYLSPTHAMVTLIDGNELIASMDPKDNDVLKSRMKAGARGAFARMNKELNGFVVALLTQSIMELPYGLAEIIVEESSRRYDA